MLDGPAQTPDWIVGEPLRQHRVGRYHVALLPPRSYEAAYTPDAAVIGFAFEGQTGVHAFASDRRQAFRTRANSLAHVPAGCEVYSESRQGGEYLTIKLDDGARDRRGERRRFNDRVDPRSVQPAQAIRRLLLCQEPTDPLKLEAHAIALEGRVAKALDDDGENPGAAAWMTGNRLRRVDEMIEANLEHDLTVQALAEALGLSAGFFSRAFKAAIGKAPHAYIIDRRLYRARSLLASKHLKLTEVALAVGFGSHAHVTAAFRNRLGVTPSQLRGQLN